MKEASHRRPCIVWFHAAAAKSLQSCPTLCDPVDGSPPGSPIPGILQARILEWVAIVISGQRRSPRKQQQKGILKAWPRVCSYIDSPIWENIRQFRPERIISNQNKAPWYVGVCWIIPVSCFLDSKNVRVSISQVMNFLQEMYIWCNVGLQRW